MFNNGLRKFYVKFMRTVNMGEKSLQDAIR